MKVLGADLIDWWKNGFPEGYFIDDSPIEETDDGTVLWTDPDTGVTTPVDPAVKYDASALGYLSVYDEGSKFDRGSELDAAKEMRKYLRSRGKATVVVLVPQGDLAAFLAMLPSGVEVSSR